jgi:LmbE family N-acetylglucosaminyl deacetylase
VVTFDSDGCTGHPDHLACHEIGVRAGTVLSALDWRLGGLALISEPIRRGRHVRRSHGTPTGDVIEVDVAAVHDRKEAAVRCHFSQVGDAVDDRTRLALFDRGSAVARYVPHALAKGRTSRHERFVWVTAKQLAATGAA